MQVMEICHQCFDNHKRRKPSFDHITSNTNHFQECLFIDRVSSVKVSKSVSNNVDFRVEDFALYSFSNAPSNLFVY